MVSLELRTEATRAHNCFSLYLADTKRAEGTVPGLAAEDFLVAEPHHMAQLL